MTTTLCVLPVKCCMSHKTGASSKKTHHSTYILQPAQSVVSRNYAWICVRNGSEQAKTNSASSGSTE